jgi:hypothetical protein
MNQTARLGVSTATGTSRDQGFYVATHSTLLCQQNTSWNKVGVYNKHLVSLHLKLHKAIKLPKSRIK